MGDYLKIGGDWVAYFTNGVVRISERENGRYDLRVGYQDELVSAHSNCPSLEMAKEIGRQVAHQYLTD